MKWSHLPMDGGLFNQNPDLLDRFMYLFQEKQKAEEREQAAERRRNPRASRRASRSR